MKSEFTDRYGEERANRIAYLVAGYLRQTLSEKEHDELDEWITASDENQKLFEELVDPENIKKGLSEYDEPDTEKALQKIKGKLQFTDRVGEKQRTKARIIRFSIAASIILLGGAVIFYLMNKRKDGPEIVKNDRQDIEAGGNRATLTTADGRVIDLVTAKNGLIDSSDGPDVLKAADGQISYEGNKDNGSGSHVLSTPAGGQYAVTLPDGTRVWLNAKSKLTYPVRFDDKERVVQLEGEGYFEVATSLRDPEGRSKLPFIVKLRNGIQVEVKGTHFNINAYDDEDMIEATLLEGRVELGSEQPEVRRELLPRQMGLVRGAGDIITVADNVDTTSIIAWKNGMFRFRDAPVETIMRQVARWYDAEIAYEGKVDYHFNATIYRRENVSRLLEILETTYRVHFSIEGKKITVRP
jgi:ferric-dicitrate binding protein FerR (iron transport regulator)